MNTLKIDIGCGPVLKNGFIPHDIKDGNNAQDLSKYADESVDEIHASHVLENLERWEVQPTIKEWSRALKPNGRLEIAVPDFEVIADAYVKNKSLGRAAGYVMGGGTDENDFHKTIWDEETLRRLCFAENLNCIGKYDGLNGAERLPVSLNLAFIKRPCVRIQLPLKDVIIAMSTPRLSWTDNVENMMTVCFQLGCKVHRHTGAFWGQCLEVAMGRCIEDPDCRYILTCDYDTIFDADDVAALYRTMERHPDMFALCSMQVHRDKDALLANMIDENGAPLTKINYEDTLTDAIRIKTGAFGLTLIRVSKLALLPHPWFMGVPNQSGEWGEGRTDDDMYFWKKANELGLKCYIAPQVRIGHLQVMCTWMNEFMQVEHQYVSDYRASGRPKNCRTL
jgi:hypothetical protein